MDTQEKFDDIIRSKFSEREITFDEANWENIKKMTDAARETKKHRRWGIIFLIGLVAGVGATLAFLFNSNTDAKIAENKTELPIENKINNVTKKNNENEKKEDKTVAPLQNASDAKAAENIQTESKAIENKKEVVSSNESKEVNIKNTGTSPVYVPGIKKESVKSDLQINVKAVEKENTDPAVSLTMKKKNTETKKENASIEVNDKGKSEVAIISTPKVKQTKENVKAEVNDKGKSEVAIVSTPKVKTVKENASVEVNDKGKSEVSIISTPKVKENATDEVKDKEKSNATIVSTPKVKTNEEKTPEITNQGNITAAITPTPKSLADTSTKQQEAIKENVSVAVKDTTTKPVTPVVASTKDSVGKKADNTLPINPWALSAVAGISYHENISHFNPIAGIEITKSVSKKIKLGAGVYYTWLALSELDCPTKTYSSVTYDFGASNEYTELAVTKIHYGVLNLFGEFSINSKNALVAGVNLYYLLTTSNTISTYDLTYTNNTPSSITETHGYSSGLSPYDVGVMAGYRRKIIGKLDIGLYVNYGLINIIGNDYPIAKYSAPVTLKNYSVQLQLKYNLFKK